MFSLGIMVNGHGPPGSKQCSACYFVRRAQPRDIWPKTWSSGFSVVFRVLLLRSRALSRVIGPAYSLWDFQPCSECYHYESSLQNVLTTRTVLCLRICGQATILHDFKLCPECYLVRVLSPEVSGFLLQSSDGRAGTFSAPTIVFRI